jgi:hypothetical protein
MDDDESIADHELDVSIAFDDFTHDDHADLADW